MKKLLHAIQAIGFILFVFGCLSIDSNFIVGTFLIIIGLAIMIEFAKLEDSYCFVEHEKWLCQQSNPQSQNSTCNAITMCLHNSTRERKKSMVKCKRCGGNYDNGELIGGKCIECLEEERQEQIRAGEVAKIMNSQSYQMEMNLEVLRK